MFVFKYITVSLMLFLVLVFLPELTYAQTTDQLIGLQRIISPVNGYSLNTVDPNNGQTNVLTNLSSPSLQASESTFDSSSNQFFVQDCPGSFGTPCQLITLDGNTGSVINSVSTPHVSGLHMSMNTTLIGFERIISPVNGYRLLTIDPANGQTTTIANYANPNFVVLEAAYDSTNNYFFVQECPGGFGVPCQLYTIDVTSGGVVSTVLSPHINGLHVNGSNSLIGLQRIISPVNGYSLNTVDPNNGQTTTIANYANPNFVPNEIAFSQTNNTIYVQDCPGGFGVPCTLYSILTTTGVIATTVSTPRINGLRIMPINTVNSPPLVDTITVSPNPVQINVSTTATASFTDVNASDTHTAEFVWGDGQTTQCPSASCTLTESNGSGAVSATHVYSAADVYEINLKVTDSDTAEGNAPPFQYLSVYSPTNQGKFNAVRKFQSPTGALISNPSLTGEVRFGVSSGYTGSNATGDVDMNFSIGNFEFISTSIQSLVTVNGKATLRGTGTVNGSGNYSFLATGIDSSDTVRFQIKDGSNNVVYDTQPGAADTADPTTQVTAGNVIVH